MAQISKEDYNRMVAAFRKTPGHYCTVAKLCCVAPRTAKRAWDEGWPKRGMEPIKIVHAEEKFHARASVGEQLKTKREDAAQARENAIQSAAQSRAQEGQIVALARGTALQAFDESVKLGAAARKLAERVKEQILERAELDHGDARAFGVSDGLRTLTAIANLQNRIEQNAMLAFQLERIHLGEPGATPNIITSQGEMTMDELTVRIEMAQDALDSARKAGGLTVIAGGLKEPVIGKKVVI